MLSLALAAILSPPPTPVPDPYAGWTIHHVTDFRGKPFTFCIPSNYKQMPNPSKGAQTEYAYTNSADDVITIVASGLTGEVFDGSAKEDVPNPLPPKGKAEAPIESTTYSAGDYLVGINNLTPTEPPYMGGWIMGAILPMASHKRAFDVDYTTPKRADLDKGLVKKICTWIANHNPVSTP